MKYTYRFWDIQKMNLEESKTHTCFNFSQLLEKIGKTSL